MNQTANKPIADERAELIRERANLLRALAKANADKAGLIKALDETITMLEMRIEIDSDKDFETANDQIAALLKFSGGTRSAWAETAPRVILSARTALSQVQA